MGTNSLRIAAWNSNGLTGHKYELELFLNNSKIDILLVAETHFTDRSVFKIPHYAIYHSNHPDGTAHGGTAILIRNHLSHYEMPAYQTDKIQATIITVDVQPCPITIAAVYSPPRHPILPIEYTNFVQRLGTKFIAGGDWNAKHTAWGSRLITPKGRSLLRALNELNCTHLSTGEPTHWPADTAKIPDVLDFFVLKGIGQQYTDIKPSFDLSSDHTPIILTISAHPIIHPTIPKLVTSKTDWTLFSTHIHEQLYLQIPLKTPEDIDRAVQNITSVLIEAAWVSTPPSYRNAAYTNSPLHIRELITDKRRARSLWQRSRNPRHKNAYNRLSRQLKQELQEIRNVSFHTYLTSLSKDDHSIWKATKHLKRPTTHIPPLKKEDGSWARTNLEKANAFADYLTTVFTPHPSSITTTPDTDEDISAFLTSPSPSGPPIRLFTPAEVRNMINNCPPYKAPGFDLITAEVLQKVPRKALVLLTYIYNAMLRLKYFPLTWKFGYIINVPKPGKPPNDVRSYRPITLLPLMSKVFERLLLHRMEQETNLDALIPTHQFGFRKSLSTIQQAHRLINEIIKSYELKKLSTAAFMDVAQAFDKVWHPGLLYKLKKALPTDYYLLLHSYLSHRFFQVKITSETSPYHPIRAGVPQGSVLGPILYLIFTADIPTTDNTVIATYADDTALLAVADDPHVASARLQSHLHLLQEWTAKWRIQINDRKSAHITFTNRQCNCPAVTFNNTPLPTVTEVKYLGLTLDRKLTWRAHIAAKKKQINLKLHQTYWLLGRTSQLSLQNKCLLYKCIIKPIWTYGVQLWGCAKPTHTKIIQRLQSKILRLLLNAPWYVSNKTLHADLCIPYVDEEIKRLAARYLHKLPAHTNDRVRQLSQPPTDRRRLRRQWPLDLISA
jgi:hypothetical protein